MGFVEEHAKGFSCSADTVILKYKDVFGFLKGAKSRPLFMLFGGKEPPDWFAGLAGEYVNGKKKIADFGFVPSSKDGQKIAKRFGVVTKSKGGKTKGALLAFHGLKKDKSAFLQMPGKLKSAVATQFAKEVIGRSAKDVEKLMKEKAAKSTPPFPPPKVPRKKAPTSLTELTTAKKGEQKCWKQSRICLLFLLEDSAEDDETEAETTLRALVRRLNCDCAQEHNGSSITDIHKMYCITLPSNHIVHRSQHGQRGTQCTMHNVREREYRRRSTVTTRCRSCGCGVAASST